MEILIKNLVMHSTGSKQKRDGSLGFLGGRGLKVNLALVITINLF